MRIQAGAFALLVGCALAQEPPPGDAPRVAPVILENHGKPMALPFQCTAEDIHWGGLTCSDEDPCPVYLELSAADSSPAGRIIAAGNIHSSAVTLYSALLASEDAGHTWTEAHARLRGADLDHIQFADAEQGWISGQQLSPLPQEPFLLLTSDGGKTWRQRAIFNDNVDNRYGSIQQFYFGSKSSGSAIIDRGQGAQGDRYALYESPDGGENWLIKEESNKAIRMRPAPPVAVSGWRVRVDGATQSWNVERRQGERWIPVASFSVKMNPCKPPAQTEASPAEAGVQAAPAVKQIVIKK